MVLSGRGIRDRFRAWNPSLFSVVESETVFGRGIKHPFQALNQRQLLGVVSEIYGLKSETALGVESALALWAAG
jgi:hypothetical protein